MFLSASDTAAKTVHTHKTCTNITARAANTARSIVFVAVLKIYRDYRSYKGYSVICSAMIGCLRKIEAEEANFSTDSVVKNLIVPP